MYFFVNFQGHLLQNIEKFSKDLYRKFHTKNYITLLFLPEFLSSVNGDISGGVLSSSSFLLSISFLVMVGALYDHNSTLNKTFLNLVRPRLTSRVTRAYKFSSIGVSFKYITRLEKTIQIIFISMTKWGQVMWH